MEMELNNSDVDDESSKELNSSSSSYQNGINGEPEILPRVGDQYQADIPVFVSKHDRLNLVKRLESENLITFGLSIPLMWARSEKFKGFREIETEKPSLSSDEHESEPKPTRKTKRTRGIVLALPCLRNVKLKFDWLDKCLYPFPGTLGESWEDFEKERFLLGLYYLGKNLVLVQRFVGSKKMGDLLEYYYGSFYRSNEYRRWVDGRKIRSRKSVQGQKLFTGWRFQELISRISNNVSEECKSMLLKVSKEFREDKIDLEEFVFRLKDLVGIDLLTEAIGIGKGKKDLTNSGLEPTKNNNVSDVVKIKNDLAVSDIVKFLKGEYRMSKNKSCDLFWEAVWPRLLARGWHSEQPKDGPRNSLVFLIPEAKKFSRRKMLKGKHYFDSLADVLNKVKLEPKLLLLEDEKESKVEEEDKNVDDDDSSPNGKRKKRYLQPRSKPITMFTIVDSSKPSGVKEMRSLPVEIGSSYLSEAEDSLSEESENEKVEETTMVSRVCVEGGSIGSVNMEIEKPKKNKGGRPRNKPVCAKKKSSLLVDCTLRESVCFGQTRLKKKKPNPSEAEHNVVKLSSEDDDSFCRPERKPREDFDLNVAQIDSQEQEDNNDGDVTVKQQNSEKSCAEQSSVQETVENLIPERRQSTRTRPLTARALEAIAFGYLGNSKKKRKASEDEPRSKSRRKSTKRIHRYSEFRNGIVEDGSNTDDE